MKTHTEQDSNIAYELTKLHCERLARASLSLEDLSTPELCTIYYFVVTEDLWLPEDTFDEMVSELRERQRNGFHRG